MGMVRINYEQMEQLRECKLKMQLPLSSIVAEAVSHWLEFVAPARLQMLGLAALAPVCKEQSQPHLGLVLERSDEARLGAEGRAREVGTDI
jgi:hypothetical protein